MKPSTSVDMVPNSDPAKLPGAVRNGGVVQEKPSSPQAALSTRAADDWMSDGELEEAIMDMSRSDIDEAELSLYSPKPIPEIQDISDFDDDDENYEPPSEISITQQQEPDPDAVLLHQDFETAKANLPAAPQKQPSADQDAEPIEKPTSGEPSPSANANMAGDERSQRSLSHRPSLAAASDPGDYEPPEPAPLGEGVARPTQTSSVNSEKSFSPHNVETKKSVAPASSESTTAVRRQVSVDAIMVGAKSHSVRCFSTFPIHAHTN